MSILSRVAVKSGDTDYDFNVYSVGLENTVPGKSVGPCVRSKYVIHYVLGGRGTFNGIPIERGDGFLICPNQLHKYTSDVEAPLQYGWISFYGYETEKVLSKAGIELRNQVFKCDWIDDLDTLFELLCRDRFDTIDAEKYLEGCFHILMSFHIKAYNERTMSATQKSLTKEHVAEAVKYINANYCRRLTVEEVAAECFVSAHYLSNIFKREMGFSPQNYIVGVRIKRAKELLAIENLSITDIANSVGYADVLAFSKIFRKNVGVSPSVYRARLIEGKDK
ncbi:MAG: AraC family transcriptional regulator [Clostridia bacterium]|nr:AraC family transcriptional regulator [Clostridia bacterium]